MKILNTAIIKEGKNNENIKKWTKHKNRKKLSNRRNREFIDITPLIINKETLKEITTKFVKHIENQEIDYIVASTRSKRISICITRRHSS